MIVLSDNISSFLCNEYFNISYRNEFSNEELDKVTRLRLSKNDIKYLEFFRNVEELEFSMFPSIDDEDIKKVGLFCRSVKKIIIQEQNDLFNLDLSNFSSLNSLSIVHNDNLISVSGIRRVSELEIYDNKDYMDVEYLLSLVNGNINVKLDIVYYVYMVRILVNDNRNADVLDKCKWIESIGIRDFSVKEYSTEEVHELYELMSSIVSKYIFVTDGIYEKVGILYQWMINNIKFVNEDVDKNENILNFNSVDKVFSYMIGGRLSYAKAFQLLLSVASVDARIVYSFGADENIGCYNGEKVYSLFGNSDYALLRLRLDDKSCYLDVAWDCYTKDFVFASDIRLFLISKEEIKRRHKIVGEGNVGNSSTYHEDDVEDLIMFSKNRINDVDRMFMKLDENKSLLLGAELNYSYASSEVDELKNKLSSCVKETEEYREINYSLNASFELLDYYYREMMEYERVVADYISDKKEELLSMYYGNEEQRDIDRRLKCYEISNEIYEIIKNII